MLELIFILPLTVAMYLKTNVVRLSNILFTPSRSRENCMSWCIASRSSTVSHTRTRCWSSMGYIKGTRHPFSANSISVEVAGDSIQLLKGVRWLRSSLGKTVCFCHYYSGNWLHIGSCVSVLYQAAIFHIRTTRMQVNIIDYFMD